MRAAWLLTALPVLVCAFACNSSSATDEDDRGAAPDAKVGAPSTTAGQQTTNPIKGTDAGLTPVVSADVDFVEHTVNWNGEDRKYLLGTPKGYDPNKSYPLVMALHGNPSSKETLRKQAPFEVGSKREAFLVYPDASGGGWDLVTPTETNKDMGFIRALPALLAKQANLDLTRVYGFGFSGGAFFVTTLGCRFGDLFRAISVNSGGAPDESQSGYPQRDDDCYVCPGGPIPTLVVHGMSDGTVVKASGVYAATCAAETNGCATIDVKSASTPAGICTKADGCAAPTELCLVQGLGHAPWEKTFEKSWSFFKAAP